MPLADPSKQSREISVGWAALSRAEKGKFEKQAKTETGAYFSNVPDDAQMEGAGIAYFPSRSPLSELKSDSNGYPTLAVSESTAQAMRSEASLLGLKGGRSTKLRSPLRPPRPVYF
jgi:hypothetical protein